MISLLSPLTIRDIVDYKRGLLECDSYHSPMPLIDYLYQEYQYVNNGLS